MIWLLFACRCAPAEGPATEAHYSGSEALVQALRSGDLAAAQAAAAALEGQPPAAGEEAQAALDRLHGALGLAVVAEELPEAADAAAVVAVSCGRCHAAVGATPMSAPPPTEAGPEALHRQASEALWWAAVAGDRPTWEAADRAQRRALAALRPEAALPERLGPSAELSASASWELDLAAWLEGCPACHAASAR